MSIPEIVKVVLVDLDKGKETVLIRKKKSNRKDSRCFFVDWFPHGNKEIQFRLDYNDKPTVDPVLDVDVRDAVTKQLIEKSVWHHNGKKYDSQSNMNIYTFKFEDLTLRLYTRTTSQISMKSDAVIADRIETILKKDANIQPQ